MATVPNRFAPHAVAANDVKCASVLLSIDVHDRLRIILINFLRQSTQSHGPRRFVLTWHGSSRPPAAISRRTT